jgi:hypothetical protein
VSDFATEQLVTNNGSRGVSHVVRDHFQRKAEPPVIRNRENGLSRQSCRGRAGSGWNR